MKYLFFDLDHTLWDYVKNSREALREGYDEIGLKSLGVDSLAEFIKAYECANDYYWKYYREGKIGKEEFRKLRFEMMMKPWGLDKKEGLSQKLTDHYVSTSPYKVGLIEGAIETLEALKQRGHKMSLLTNGFEEIQHIKVESSGLSKYFEGLLTSDALGYKKPNPEIFHLALRKMGVNASDSVMLGDSLEADILGAKTVGMGQVFFNPDEVKHSEEIQHEVKSLSEILDIVLH